MPSTQYARISRAVGECEVRVHAGRPDRGPEGRCFYRARYAIRGHDLRVCGNHARAWIPAVRIEIGTAGWEALADA